MRCSLLFLLAFCVPLLASAQPEWIEHTIDGASGDESWIRRICTADVDGDMDVDVLMASAYSEPSFAWFENLDGTGSSWGQHNLTNANLQATSIYATDMDGDGDIDVLGSVMDYGGEMLHYWENADGAGTVWTEHVLTGDSRATDIHASDINGDGLTDILFTDFSFVWPDPLITSVKWLQNNGSNNVGSWLPRGISMGLFSVFSDVYSADIDSDGDMDALAAIWLVVDSPTWTFLYWFKNLDGTGTNWTIIPINFLKFERACDIYTIDMDGDGDMDVFGASVNSNDIRWWENIDGSGYSWAEHIVTGSLGGACSVHLGDFDSDGDMDIAGAGMGQDAVLWWDNYDGTGRWLIDRYIGDRPSQSIGVCCADMDGDGDDDVVSVWADGEINWWEYPGYTPPDLIEVTLVPTSSTIIPAGGGTLEFDVHVQSNLPDLYPNAMFWTKVELPNGAFYSELLYSMTFDLEPYMDFWFSLTQDVPSFAPAGFYELWGFVGSSPNAIRQFGGFFPFDKMYTATDGEPVSGWNSNDGSSTADLVDESSSLPVVHEMLAVYPNPFNAATTLTVALTEASDLTVTVYNVSGQQVAKLADGHFAAGEHSLTFDASQLASGLYFIRAIVPDRFDQTQKVMLVR